MLYNLLRVTWHGRISTYPITTRIITVAGATALKGKVMRFAASNQAVGTYCVVIVVARHLFCFGLLVKAVSTALIQSILQSGQSSLGTQRDLLHICTMMLRKANALFLLLYCLSLSLLTQSTDYPTRSRFYLPLHHLHTTTPLS